MAPIPQALRTVRPYTETSGTEYGMGGEGRSHRDLSESSQAAGRRISGKRTKGAQDEAQHLLPEARQ